METLIINYFRHLNGKNKIKLNENEYNFLKETIKELESNSEGNEGKKKFIKLDVSRAIEINKYFNIEKKRIKSKYF